MNSEFPDELRWYCLRAQTKREHIAAAGLAQIEGVEAFCPRIRYQKATRRGKIWWVESLFPGYLLARFVFRSHYREVTHSQGVSTIIHFGDKVPAVSESFVEALKCQIAQQESEADVVTLKQGVSVGDEVELMGDAFRGMQAEVVEVLSGGDRIMVLMDFLGNQNIVEVDLYSLIMKKKPSF